MHNTNKRLWTESQFYQHKPIKSTTLNSKEFGGVFLVCFFEIKGMDIR